MFFNRNEYNVNLFMIVQIILLENVWENIKLVFISLLISKLYISKLMIFVKNSKDFS